jgi:hypothetical protein
MAIDEHATTDLSLSAEDAENIVGGQKKNKKKPAAKTYTVDFIQSAGATPGSAPEAAQPSMDADDCGPES